MKMLTITKGVTSEYFHTHTAMIDFLHFALTALKYETPMFQEFRTHLFDNCFISYLGLCICFIF